MVSALIVVSLLVLAFGLRSCYDRPATVILPPDKLRQAAMVDQELNKLQFAASKLASEIEHHYILGRKQRRTYWQRFKPLVIRYRQPSRSGFASGSKLTGIKITFDRIRKRLIPASKRPKRGKNSRKTEQPHTGKSN